MSSAYSRPGSRRWVCRSTKPGSRIWPVASMTSASSGIASSGTDVGDLAVGDQHVDAFVLAVAAHPADQNAHALIASCSAPDQQVEQHRHPDMHTVGNLLQHSGLRRIGHRGRDLHAAQHRAGVQHHRVARQHRLALLGQPVEHRVLARRREESAVHPLGLHPQHQHRVGDRQLGVEVVRHRHRPAGHPDRQQRRRRHQHHLGAQRVEQQHVGPGHPAVQDVADDHHPFALDAAEPLPDGQRIQQRLRGMFVGAVAGVDHRSARRLRWPSTRRAAGRRRTRGGG